MKTLLLLAASAALTLTVGFAYADGDGGGDDHLREWALSVEQHDAANGGSSQSGPLGTVPGCQTNSCERVRVKSGASAPEIAFANLPGQWPRLNHLTKTKIAFCDHTVGFSVESG